MKLSTGDSRRKPTEGNARKRIGARRMSTDESRRESSDI
jgi:hypothetical protein